MQLISIVSGCYNEEGNVLELYEQAKKEMSKLPQYQYEFIFIDNASKDTTVSVLKEIAKKDKNVKIIVNSRNFGHIRSPFYGLLQAKGDAAIIMASDLQHPPCIIEALIKKWEEGFKVVKAVKTNSEEAPLISFIRKVYYRFINKMSEIELTKNHNGFCLFDKKIVDALREVNDPYPYLRGLVSEIGFEQTTVDYEEPARKRGITKNNFYTLYDIAMLGIVSHSKIPLRIATILGFLMSSLSFLAALIYVTLKLAFWTRFPMGMAPMIISIFFFASLQLFFIGILGEYIGFIYTQVQKRPLVIEKERINFD